MERVVLSLPLYTRLTGSPEGLTKRGPPEKGDLIETERVLLRT